MRMCVEPVHNGKGLVSSPRNGQDYYRAKNILTYSIPGLPLDITEEEFITLMSKYGIIMEDLETSKLRHFETILPFNLFSEHLKVILLLVHF